MTNQPTAQSTEQPTLLPEAMVRDATEGILRRRNFTETDIEQIMLGDGAFLRDCRDDAIAALTAAGVIQLQRELDREQEAVRDAVVEIKELTNVLAEARAKCERLAAIESFKPHFEPLRPDSPYRVEKPLDRAAVRYALLALRGETESQFSDYYISATHAGHQRGLREFTVAIDTTLERLGLSGDSPTQTIEQTEKTN